MCHPEGPGQAGEGGRANLMEFNKAKGKVLPVGWDNPQHKPRLGEEWMESSPQEKDLGVLVGGKLPVSQQRALAAQKATCVLGCTQSSVGSRARGGFSPSALLSGDPPAVLGPALGAPTSGHGPARVGPEEATKIITGLEHPPVRTG